MRTPLDAAGWARLSALFDTGIELPTPLRQRWVASLGDEEPLVVEWLRAMFADVQTRAPNDVLERGPALSVPLADEAVAAPAWQGAAAPAPDVPPSADEEPEALAPAFESVTASISAAVPGADSELGPELGSEPGPEHGLEPTSSVAASIAGAEEAAAHIELPPLSAGDAEAAISEGDQAEPPRELEHQPEPEPESESDPALEPEPELEPRLVAPALATGMQLGPWLLVGPMPASDARVGQWRAHRVGTEGNAAAGRDVALLVPHQWRGRTDLAAWLGHVAARPMALVHPCIARFIDVGVAANGTPWLAAELAEGQPIERWCHDHPLELHERRVLTEQVVEAVAFAHARLVLHGNIHPSQVLVSPNRQVHWLNLGLAEMLALLDAPQADDAAHSGPSPRAYAAPELQPGAGLAGGARGAGGARNTTTVAGDVHALGLIVFEVLSGTSPWHQRPPSQTRAEAGNPRITTTATSRWPRPSNQAGTARLRRALRGEIDAIVAKATHADPTQRYGGAAELLGDLRHAAANRPVAAVDDGLRYQLACLARRHPRRASVLTVFAVLFVLGLSLLSWKAWSWTAERAQAEAAHRSAEAVSRLLQDLLVDNTRPGTERDWPALLVHAEAVARSRLTEQPGGLAGALALLGRHQAERGAFAEARNLLAEALPQLAARVEQLEAGCDEAWAQARQGDRVEEAEQRLRRVTENAGVRPVTRVLCMARLADVERRAGRRLDAYLTTIEAWKQWDQSEERPPELALLLARPMGLQSAALGRFHEAQRWFEWALKQAEALLQDQALPGLELREQWGEVSLSAGDAERAVTLADANLNALAGSAFSDDEDSATAPPAAMLLAAAEPRLELHLLADARARLERVVSLADTRADQPLRLRARCLLAAAALRERDAATATRWLKAIPADAAAANAALAAGPRDASQNAAVTGGALQDLEREAQRTAARSADQLCRTAQAELALQQGRAVEAYREADSIVNSAGTVAPRLSAAAMLLRAEALMAAKQFDRALSAALQALQQARALHQSDADDQMARPSFRSGQAALVLTEAHRANGDIESALQTFSYAQQQLAATLPESHPWRRRAEAVQAALAVHQQQQKKKE